MYISPTPAQIKAMDDGPLDQAYGAARELTKVAVTRSQGANDMQLIADEIVRRVQSPFSFLHDLTASDRFPVYYGVTGFSGAATQSVKDSAGAVTSAIGQGIGNLLGPATPFLAVAAVVLGLVVYYTRVQK